MIFLIDPVHSVVRVENGEVTAVSYTHLLLSTVVSNLVKNALAYSHEGEIEVTETSTEIP